MIFFAIRQIIVYLLIFLMSTFIGRVSGARDFAAFTLFNFVFGLTYIVADLGFGKAVLGAQNEPVPGELALAWLINLGGGLIFGLLLAAGFYSAHQDLPSSLLIVLFFLSGSGSFGWFSRSERSGNFVAIGTAEITQVLVYFVVFFGVYGVFHDVRSGVMWAVFARIVSIPLSYAANGGMMLRVSPDWVTVRSVLRRTLNGFQHQVSLVLFALKDLLLAYIVLSAISPEQRGIDLMAQTYMMIPLMFANPVSRVLLPRLSAANAQNSALTVRRIMSIMAGYAVIATGVVYAGFGLFNTILLAGKFSASEALIPYFALANVMSIPALAVASFVATTQGYRVYLAYAVVCATITWAVGACMLRTGLTPAYPVAVLSGHAINLVLIVWFLFGRREV